MIRQDALWVTGRREELSVSNAGRPANGTESVATQAVRPTLQPTSPLNSASVIAPTRSRSATRRPTYGRARS
jgi:hypothetical protein